MPNGPTPSTVMPVNSLRTCAVRFPTSCEALNDSSVEAVRPICPPSSPPMVPSVVPSSTTGRPNPSRSRDGGGGVVDDDLVPFSPSCCLAALLFPPPNHAPSVVVVAIPLVFALIIFIPRPRIDVGGTNAAAPPRPVEHATSAAADTQKSAPEDIVGYRLLDMISSLNFEHDVLFQFSVPVLSLVCSCFLVFFVRLGPPILNDLQMMR